jgi:hypothetical protein
MRKVCSVKKITVVSFLWLSAFYCLPLPLSASYILDADPDNHPHSLSLAQLARVKKQHNDSYSFHMKEGDSIDFRHANHKRFKSLNEKFYPQAVDLLLTQSSKEDVYSFTKTVLEEIMDLPPFKNKMGTVGLFLTYLGLPLTYVKEKNYPIERTSLSGPNNYTFLQKSIFDAKRLGLLPDIADRFVYDMKNNFLITEKRKATEQTTILYPRIDFVDAIKNQPIHALTTHRAEDEENHSPRNVFKEPDAYFFKYPDARPEKKITQAFFLQKMGGAKDYFQQGNVKKILTEFHSQAQTIFMNKKKFLSLKSARSDENFFLSLLKQDEDKLLRGLVPLLRAGSFHDNVILLTLLGLREVPDDFARILDRHIPGDISKKAVKSGIIVFYNPKKSTFDFCNQVQENLFDIGIKRPRDGHDDVGNDHPLKQHRPHSGE